jgi:outer membrane protein TolC
MPKILDLPSLRHSDRAVAAVWCSAVLLAPQLAWAAEPLSLPAVQAAAERWFPALLAAQEDIAAAEGERLSAQGGFDPSWKTLGGATPLGYYDNWRLDTVVQQPLQAGGANLLAGWRIGQGQFAVYDGKAETLQAGEVRAGVTLPLIRDREVDARRVALRNAAANPQIARAQRDAQVLEVRRAAAVRYWTWVEATLQLQIAKGLLQLAQDRNAGLAQRVARGDLAALELQENQRAILSRQGIVVAAERAVQSAAAELALYVRDDRGQPRLPKPEEAPPAVPVPDVRASAELAVVAERAVGRRPERLRLQLQAEQARQEAALARNQALPELDLMGTLSQDLGGSSKRLDPFNVEFGVVLDIPLRTRNADGKRQQALAKAKKAQIQTDFLYERILTDLRDLQAADQAARQRLDLARQEQVLAKQLAAAEAEQFRLGSGNALLVNLREQAAAEAEGRLVSALVELQRLRAAWVAVTAGE